METKNKAGRERRKKHTYEQGRSLLQDSCSRENNERKVNETKIQAMLVPLGFPKLRKGMSLP
jgi:hypothetical protein